MANIIDLSPWWRSHLKPASFRGARFHVEGDVAESGRRTVTHEFPKREDPYTEDLGRAARRFSVRGYIIQYLTDVEGNELFQRDFTIARDNLLAALETEGPARLQLPLYRPITVACTKYRVTHDEKRGGYCVFDMTFVEQGLDPFRAPEQSGQQQIDMQADFLTEEILNALAPDRQRKVPENV